MDSKKLKAEVDVLKQIMPSACSNVIELCGRYLAASEKMPRKQYCREGVDCNDCPFEDGEECTHKLVNKTIDDCALAMMPEDRYVNYTYACEIASALANKMAKPVVLSVKEIWDILDNFSQPQSSIFNENPYNGDLAEAIHAAMKKGE